MALEHSDLKSKLKELNEVLEKRGDRMTDTTPLMKLKDALDTINKDIKNFDLQIALLVSSLESFLISDAVSDSISNSFYYS